jgi:hypothetical protein
MMGRDIVFGCGYMGRGNYKVFPRLNGKGYVNLPVFDSMVQNPPLIRNWEVSPESHSLKFLITNMLKLTIN